MAPIYKFALIQLQPKVSKRVPVTATVQPNFTYTFIARDDIGMRDGFRQH